MILQILKAVLGLVLSTIFVTSVALFSLFLYEEIKHAEPKEKEKKDD